MKILVRIIQFLVGALFLFSGFVKAVDPLGTAYKMHDYFTAFAGDYPSLKVLWKFMNESVNFWAVFMLVLELVLGAALITGWRPKLTLWLMLALMFFFTFLTGYTYLSGYTVKHWYNPFGWKFEERDMKVTDCGCFGDFIRLKPYTSFWKDVVLDVLVVFLLAGRRHMYTLFGGRAGSIIIGLATVASLWFCFSNYLWGLPMIDFRPYAVGKNIREGMTLPPGAKKDSVVMVFVYSHGGKQVELAMDDLKKVDSTWTFVDRKDKVIVEGDHPPIHDFSIVSQDGTNITDDVLNQDNIFLLVAYEIEHSNGAVQGKVNDFVALARQNGVEFIGLTGSLPAEVDKFRHEHNSLFDYYYCDATALKTMIRSNPGLMLLQKGTVKAMWHYRDFPTFDEVKKLLKK